MNYAFFDIVQSDSREIVSRIEDGILDIGLVGSRITTDELSLMPIYKDEMLIAAPNSEPYLKLKEKGASISEILKSPYIIREDG